MVDPRRVRVSVPDVSCGHCVQSVRAALEPLAGVSDIEVSLDRKEALATLNDNVQHQLITDAIRAAGYTPGRVEDA